MGKIDKNLPPGPNPRGDLMKEKHSRQLREHMRGRPQQAGGEAEGQEWKDADQPEGERSGRPSTKVAGNPDLAEGEREKIEEELRRQEENRPSER